MMREHRVWVVERRDWFGERETMKEFYSEDAANRYARDCRLAAKHIEDPEDRVTFEVSSYIPAPVRPNGGNR
jgi:hypothetical protein